MNFFLFQVYPYIALTVLAVGSIARHETDPFTWKSSSSQLLSRGSGAPGPALAESRVKRKARFPFRKRSGPRARSGAPGMGAV